MTEKMIGQEYKLPIEETLKTAWEKVSGSKSTFWIALIITFAVLISMAGVLAAIAMLIPGITPLFQFISQLIGYIFEMGLIYMGIKRSQNLPINFAMIFYPLNLDLLLKLVGLYLLQFLIFLVPIIVIVASLFFYPISAGMLGLGILLTLIGSLGIIYLAIRMVLAMAFILDTNAGPWNAIKLSFRATHCNFWRLLFIIVLQSVIIAISVIPLGIGLIWTLPWAFINYGVFYKKLADNNMGN